jgi:hypothetical protein
MRQHGLLNNTFLMHRNTIRLYNNNNNDNNNNKQAYAGQTE